MRTPFLATRVAATGPVGPRDGRRTLRVTSAAAAGLALVGSLLPTGALAAPATFSITGSVKNVSAAPVRGLAIAVCPVPFTAHCEVATGPTAADGTFTVTGLAASEYTVESLDPAGKYPSGWYAPGGFTIDPGVATKVSVGKTPITAGIDIVYPAIFRLSGKISGSNGSPMPDATVSPFPSDATGVGDNLLKRTRSDGTFAIPVVRGTYLILVYDSRTTPRFYAQMYRKGGATSGPATVITVTADVTGINLRLQPASRVSGHVAGHVRPVAIAGCPTSPTGMCEGSRFLKTAAFDYTIAVPRTKTVVRVTGEANSPTLPGFWTKAGLVPDRAHATVLDLTKTDATDITFAAVALVTGIHAGAATTGAFGTEIITVNKGTSVTMRIALARGFAGAKVLVQEAVFDAKGVPGLFRTVATKTVPASGTVFYTTKVATMTGYRAKYIPPQEFTDAGASPAYSVNIVVKVK